MNLGNMCKEKTFSPLLKHEFHLNSIQNFSVAHTAKTDLLIQFIEIIIAFFVKNVTMQRDRSFKRVVGVHIVIELTFLQKAASQNFFWSCILVNLV